MPNKAGRLGHWLTTALAALLAIVTTHSRADEAITYIHWDALGSPVASTDESGAVVWREAYRPYGQRINNEAASGPHTRWYTGHPQDEDTGLVYAGARYYDPVIGRFLAIDPVKFQEDNLHSFSRYAYGNNNPYLFIDPDGREAMVVIGDLPENPEPGMGTWITAGGIALPLIAIGLAVSPAVTSAGTAIALGEAGFTVGATAVATRTTTSVAENAVDFFKNTRYTDKVRAQLKRGDFHSFPESVKGFQDAGKVTKLKGGDGKVRDKLEIPGGYRGHEGKFVFIKESNGDINHRGFEPIKN